MKKQLVRTGLFLAMSFLALFAAGCAISPANAPTNKTPIVTPVNNPVNPINNPVTPINQPISTGSADNAVMANNLFALDLYKHYQPQPGNIFYSPFSISSALTMAYEGAKGVTAEEMKKVLRLPDDQQALRNAYASLFSDLNGTNQNFKLSTANALWSEKTYPFNQDYLSLAAKYYDGQANSLDFAGAPEKSRQTINSWVADRTNNKILDLIPAGQISPITRLVLTNAIYFYGDWVNQFKKESTNPEPFFKDEQNKVDSQLMSQTAHFGYAENDALQVLEMPYKGNRLSMLILLPKDRDINKLENSLTLQNLNKWQKSLQNQEVDVYVPKFKLATSYFMKDDLTQMGMPTSFSDAADFSGMISHNGEPLQISEVIHKAYLAVDEKGTEAAAATAVVMQLTMDNINVKQPPVFRADHPFIFLIRENNTGAILFIGRLSDPTK